MVHELLGIKNNRIDLSAVPGVQKDLKVIFVLIKVSLQLYKSHFMPPINIKPLNLKEKKLMILLPFFLTIRRNIIYPQKNPSSLLRIIYIYQF